MMGISKSVLIVAAGWLFHNEWALYLGNDREMTAEKLYDGLSGFSKALVENMVRQIFEAAQQSIQMDKVSCPECGSYNIHPTDNTTGHRVVEYHCSDCGEYFTDYAEGEPVDEDDTRTD